jgi:hypothetical protein
VELGSFLFWKIGLDALEGLSTEFFEAVVFRALLAKELGFAEISGRKDVPPHAIGDIATMTRTIAGSG